VKAKNKKLLDARARARTKRVGTLPGARSGSHSPSKNKHLSSSLFEKQAQDITFSTKTQLMSKTHSKNEE